jgi:hypothetical protein
VESFVVTAPVLQPLELSYGNQVKNISIFLEGIFKENQT